MNKFNQFDHLHIGIFIIDENYKVIFWNKTIAEWTKIKKDTIETNNLLDFFPNLSQKKYSRRLSWILDGGPPIIFSPQLHPYLISCPLSNSKNRIVKTTVSIISADQEEKLLIFTIEDMTQPIEQIKEISMMRQSTLKELAERKIIEDELLQSRKLESIGTIAQGFAHDFNNLLAIIAGNISLLSIKQSFNDDTNKIMKRIEEASYKAADLANKLISFTPDDECLILKEPINITSLFSKITKRSNMKNINLNIEITDGLYLVNGNEVQLLEMLNNIIDNAIESIEDKGIINIHAENIVIEPNNKKTHSGNYVRILIKDTGCGISEENIDKVFDPYFSTKTEVTKKGLGFGLSIARSIVKRHNGYMSIKSEEQEGTTVNILLQPYIE